MTTTRRSTGRFSIPILLAGLGLVCALGCQSLPRSGLDPYGERLFESCPLGSLKMPECDLFGNRKTSQPTATATTATPVPEPAAVVYPGSDAGVGLLPGGLGAVRPGSSAVPQYGSTATAMDPAVRGINTALVASPDAGPTPMFEQTGGYALPVEPIEGPALIMTPREQIAPVGSEVVLISSYLGKKDRLITNEKVEWTLEGVGSILKFDPGSYCDPLYFDYTKAKKITDRYAVTKTSQVYRTLDRGTPETRDDVHLLRGQTWISVNSMREGTTHVTAFAPSLKDWSKRSDFGIIHWVDAQWVLPTLPIAPVGESRVLTTTVLRRSNGQARSDWIVQYEILNGPAAGFNSGAQIEEVRTDPSGQASIILSQRELRSGTNTIAVRIIRPAGVDGSDRRVTVGSETIRQTWSGHAGVRILPIQGPRDGKIGQDLPYTITLENSTTILARGTVLVTLPPIVSFIRSTPETTKQGETLQWPVVVPPKGKTSIQLVLRQGTAGKLMLDAKFYPQGTAPSPSSSTSIPATSVPIGSGSLGAIGVDPASRTPIMPDASGASVFHGTTTGTTTGTTGPVSPSPGAPGAVLFSNNLELKIESNPNLLPGQACRVDFIAFNRGTVPIRNAVLQLNIPAEYPDRSEAGLRAIGVSEGYYFDNKSCVNLSIPVIEPGKHAVLSMQVPNITTKGYQFIGKTFIDGKEAGQTQRLVLPAR